MLLLLRAFSIMLHHCYMLNMFLCHAYAHLDRKKKIVLHCYIGVGVGWWVGHFAMRHGINKLYPNRNLLAENGLERSHAVNRN